MAVFAQPKVFGTKTALFNQYHENKYFKIQNSLFQAGQINLNM